MITIKEIQTEICQDMIDGNRCMAIASLDDEHIGITTNGVIGYVLRKDECVFDMSKIRHAGGFFPELFKLSDDDKLLEVTPYIIENGSLKVRKLIHGAYTVYIDEKYYEKLKELCFYGNKKTERILITVGKRPFGVIMPMRINESEETEE